MHFATKKPQKILDKWILHASTLNTQQLGVVQIRVAHVTEVQHEAYPVKAIQIPWKKTLSEYSTIFTL